MAHIHDLTALEQAAAVRTGELSPVQITEHYLERIERLNPGLGAFVTVTADRALAQAREQEARLAAGDAEDLPPLLGVPIPIKDLNFVKDVPVYFGSATYEGFVAPATLIYAVKAAA